MRCKGFYCGGRESSQERVAVDEASDDERLDQDTVQMDITSICKIVSKVIFVDKVIVTVCLGPPHGQIYVLGFLHPLLDFIIISYHVLCF